MLEGYEKDRDGVIKKTNAPSPAYDEEYVKNYYSVNGAIAEELSCLRLGLLLGSLNQSVNKLLDIGYGNGGFLKRASRVIKDCYGYDVSPRFPLPENIRQTNSLTGEFYDVVTLFNSLEHMPDIDFVSDLQCRYVVITVPWCHYFSDDWFDSWKHRKPDEHVWHFNDESLTRFMNSKGYSILHTSNAEDSLRGEPLGYPSYLTSVFKKG